MAAYDLSHLRADGLYTGISSIRVQCSVTSMGSLYLYLFHRLHGSASPVLTATGFVNGKGQFSTPHRIDTPQPITKQFATGDYVGDPLRLCQITCISVEGVFWHMGEI